MKYSLYNITHDYLRAIDQLADEPDAQKAADILECIGGALQDKLGNVALYVRTLDANRDMVEQEIARLTIIKDSLSVKRATLVKRMDDAMAAAGITEVAHPLLTIKRKKNPPACEIYNEALLPAQYMVQPEPPAPKPDKRAILAALKAGEQIEGARIVQADRLVIE